MRGDGHADPLTSTKTSKTLSQVLNEPQLFRWRDIAWLVHRKELTHADVVKIALDRIGESSTEAEYVLAALPPADAWRIQPALDNVVAEEGTATEDSDKRWLFATLRDIFENAETIGELRRATDELFCDRDHPEEMADFVTWMPAPVEDDPGKHTYEENIQRLATRVAKYLEDTAARYGAQPPKRWPSDLRR